MQRYANIPCMSVLGISQDHRLPCSWISSSCWHLVTTLVGTSVWRGHLEGKKHICHVKIIHEIMPYCFLLVEFKTCIHKLTLFFTFATQQLFVVLFTDQCCSPLYFVSSRELPWRHWSRPRIHAAKRILYAWIPVFLFERVRKHTSCARVWQASSSGIRADVTVVLEVRQSIGISIYWCKKQQFLCANKELH